jgi:hypothetical protein
MFLICDLWWYDRSAKVLILYFLYLGASHLRTERAFTLDPGIGFVSEI